MTSEEQVGSSVKPIARGCNTNCQVPVNPVMAPLKHNKLISSQSLCNLDIYWLLNSTPRQEMMSSFQHLSSGLQSTQTN